MCHIMPVATGLDNGNLLLGPLPIHSSEVDLLRHFP